MEKYIAEVLSPKIQGDGGWIEFVSFENGVLTVVSEENVQNVLFLTDVLIG